RPQIHKQPRSSDCGIETPRECSFACRKRSVHTNVNGRQAADHTRIKKFAYLQKAGKRTPIVRNPERYACTAKCFEHPDTFLVTDCHWFFNEAGLARSSYP